MSYPPYIREKARRMRIEMNLSLDEIAERLALPKTTVWYWIQDLPLGRERRWSTGQRKGNEGMRLKYKLLRDSAYEEGAAAYEQMAADPTFRDFVCLYLAEGYKRDRNTVSVANSDPAVVKLCADWIRALTRNKIEFAVQHHEDQDLEELRSFWGALLGVPPSTIRLQRKSNSNRLSKRTWRSEHGVLTVRVGDTLLRAKIQAWMDRLRASWA